MNPIIQVPLHEWFVVTDSPSPGQILAQWSEQKSMMWMEDVLSRFLKAGQLVFGSCASKLATCEDSVLLSNHSRSVRRELEALFSGKSLAGVIEVFARQASNNELVMQGEKAVKDECGGAGLRFEWDQNVKKESNM